MRWSLTSTKSKYIYIYFDLEALMPWGDNEFYARENRQQQIIRDILLDKTGFKLT